MKKHVLPVFVLSCAFSSAFAQAPADPPPILELVQRPGYTATTIKPYAEVRAAVNVVGLTSVTGEPESWFLEMHLNYTSLEQLDQAWSTLGTPPPVRTLIATFQPQWSYRPEQAIRQFALARYLQVTVYRLGNASEAAFAKIVDLQRGNKESQNLDRPDMAYEVVSGAPAGTYIFLSPMANLRGLDEGVPSTPAYAQALAEERAKLMANTPASDISREHRLFRVEPRLSYVSDDFAAANPEFWRGH